MVLLAVCEVSSTGVPMDTRREVIMATRKKLDVSWIHQAASIAATFNAQDKGRIVAVDYTTVLGALPHEKGEEPTWIVHVQGTETESRGEYSWTVEEHWSVTRKSDGTPMVDEATDEQIAQVEGK
jgi:hypothetical protein